MHYALELMINPISMINRLVQQHYEMRQPLSINTGETVRPISHQEIVQSSMKMNLIFNHHKPGEVKRLQTFKMTE